MTQKKSNNWFDSVDFNSIVSTVKGVMTSDGSMSILLDFERVLDESDIYAFKNWLLGELVDGPNVGRYDVSCTFMWPRNLMPDPRAVKRLWAIGCDVKWVEKEIKVPVEVDSPDDFVQGTNYPKAAKRKVWLVQITIPMELMDDIKEGSIDLAGSTIDIEDLDNAYNEDLDKQGAEDQEGAGGGMGAAPMAAPAPTPDAAAQIPTA